MLFYHSQAPDTRYYEVSEQNSQRQNIGQTYNIFAHILNMLSMNKIYLGKLQNASKESPELDAQMTLQSQNLIEKIIKWFLHTIHYQFLTKHLTLKNLNCLYLCLQGWFRLFQLLMKLELPYTGNTTSFNSRQRPYA